MSIQEKIKEIEDEVRGGVSEATDPSERPPQHAVTRASPASRSPPQMARTQKNKATERHIGLLKAKIAKLKAELIGGPKVRGSPRDRRAGRREDDGWRAGQVASRAPLVRAPHASRSRRAAVPRPATGST